MEIRFVSHDAPQEPQPLWAFICRQHAEKYRIDGIVRCCNITLNTVSICIVPDTTERIDERNLSTPAEENYFGSHRKTTFEPSADKIALNPDRGAILVERQNNSEGS